ncbi:hypothetical protein [Lentzea flava]|uniref:hypothetical protein n=1 Tax=Lentzea flava TaxID=103732 RepID=UPI001670EFBC|nr:hypothetical protein [Lentzea flava]MCP2201624.1 hypothetical protein [Lentzea flava]
MSSLSTALRRSRALAVAAALVSALGATLLAPPATAAPEKPEKAETPATASMTVTQEDIAASATLTRSEVLTRARSWVDPNVKYSQLKSYTNQYGTYRTDCSGFVSMAWGLSRSETTRTLHNFGTWLNSLDELKPGDAINDVENHVVLFVSWTDSSHTVANVYESTSYGGIEGPDPGTIASRYTRSKLVNGGYRGLRAHNVIDDAPQAPAGVRSIVTASGGSQIFGIGADGHVMSTFWSPNITDNGGWHAWFAIPTGYADGTTAPNSTVSVTTINGQTQLFTTAPDRHVISTFWSPSIPTNGGWHDWFVIPTGHADGVTAPGSVVTAGGTQLFTTAADGHVMSTFWSPSIPTNGGWHEWFAIPTGYANGKTAPNSTVSVTTINGQAQLFTTAPDRRVISTFWSSSIPTNGGWHEWFAIPTGHADGITAPNATITAGGTQLFTTGADGHVMSTFWSPTITTNGGWHAWFAIPTGYADGTTAPNSRISVTTLNGQTQLFTTAPDGQVISTFWSSSIPTNGGWREWFAIPTGYANGKSATGSGVSVTTLNGQVQLFTAAPDGQVISTFWSSSIPTNGGWHSWFAIPTGHSNGHVRI